MSLPLAPSLLARFTAYVTTHLGLYFPQERWPDLERGLHAAARESGFGDVVAYSRWLMSPLCGKEQIAQLASHLTIGETYFFREKTTFEILEQQILPLLIEVRRKSIRHLSIWSAGCCTGEEPYSIAILLSQLLPDWQDWSVTILGTDISLRFLQKAAEGVYGEWSFRDVAPWLKERYFRRTRTGRYEILPQIKQRVTFSQVNLADATYPLAISNAQPFDIIFCRNVLMYFAVEQTKKTIQKLHATLSDGGWLVVSPSDAIDALYSPLARVNFPGAIFYQRSGQTHHAPEDRAGQTISRSLFAAHNTAEERTQQLSVLSGAALRLYNEGSYVEAEQEALGLLAQYPQASQAATLLARIYANQGKLAQARQWCEQAIAADRMNPDAYYLQATIQQEQGELREAQTSLRQTLYLDPDFVLAHFALGYCALQQGKIAEASKSFANTKAMLSAYRPEERLPDSDGLTSGELMEIMRVVNL